jgi:hypothetical protein
VRNPNERRAAIDHGVVMFRLSHTMQSCGCAAAGESYLQISLKRAIEGVTVGDVMTSDCPTVSGNLDLQHFVEEELLKSGRRCFVENGSGSRVR